MTGRLLTFPIPPFPQQRGGRVGLPTSRSWQEKRQVEKELYRWGVLRYGWQEEALEGVPGVKVCIVMY